MSNTVSLFLAACCVIGMLALLFYLITVAEKRTMEKMEEEKRKQLNEAKKKLNETKKKESTRKNKIDTKV